MARRSKEESRPAMPGNDDKMELQGRGIGGEGGAMGETTRQGDEADAEKSPLANDAGMEGVVAASQKADQQKKKQTKVAKSWRADAEGEGSRTAKEIGRTTRKRNTEGSDRRGGRMVRKGFGDEVSGLKNSTSNDRETRVNPHVPPERGMRGTGDRKHDVSGSQRRTSGQRTQFTQVDRGAGGADRT